MDFIQSRHCFIFSLYIEKDEINQVLIGIAVLNGLRRLFYLLCLMCLDGEKCLRILWEYVDKPAPPSSAPLTLKSAFYIAELCMSNIIEIYLSFGTY